MRQKTLKYNFYMKGKFGNLFSREILNKDCEFLYGDGRRKTNIKEVDMPESYIKLHSKAFCYTEGFVNAKGIKHVYCKCIYNNHRRKDDSLYISYDKVIEVEKDNYGFDNVKNWDYHLCGNCIDIMIDAIAKFSPECDISMAMRELAKKDEFLKKNYPEILH